MPRNGSGLFTLAQPPFVNGTAIDPSPVNSDFSDIATALTGSVASDGQTPMTGTLNMNANAITGATTIAMTGALSGATTIAASSIVGGSNIGRGALVYLASNQTIANNTPTDVIWTTEVFDDATLWTAGTPTRFTIPTGFTRAALQFGLEWLSTTNGAYYAKVLKNGAVAAGLPYINFPNNLRPTSASAMVAVTAGDYFTLQVYQNDGLARDLIGTVNTWFAIQLLR